MRSKNKRLLIEFTRIQQCVHLVSQFFIMWSYTCFIDYLSSLLWPCEKKQKNHIHTTSMYINSACVLAVCLQSCVNPGEMLE